MSLASLLGMDRVNTSRLSTTASRLMPEVMGPGNGGGAVDAATRAGDEGDDDEDQAQHKDESDSDDRFAVEGVVLSPSSSVPPPRSLDRLIWSPHCQSEWGGGVRSILKHSRFVSHERRLLFQKATLPFLLQRLLFLFWNASFSYF